MDPAGSHVQRDTGEKSGISELWTRFKVTSSHQMSRRPVIASHDALRWWTHNQGSLVWEIAALKKYIYIFFLFKILFQCAIKEKNADVPLKGFVNLGGQNYC